MAKQTIKVSVRMPRGGGRATTKVGRGGRRGPRKA